MSQTFDYLIVGQGLAGSILAMELIEVGYKIQIIDNPDGPSSSKVAAGIFNPITGKRFVKTWFCDEIYPNIYEYYEKLEKQLGQSFLHKTQIIRPIETIKEQNQLIELASRTDHSNYIDYLFENSEISATITSNFGLITTKIGGWVNVPVLLEATKKHLISNSNYYSQIFDYELIEIKEKSIKYNNQEYRKIIFCEGYNSTNNLYFNWLPFNAVKGEVLIIETKIDLQNFILLKGIFVVPLGNYKYKVGATYNWADKTTENTEAGKLELQKKLENLIGPNFKIINQTAGIRPATVDRRPFLGLHPQYTQLAIFNGLGTKGVSLAPYFAKEMVNFLENNKQLNPEININRFSSLYLEHNF